MWGTAAVSPVNHVYPKLFQCAAHHVRYRRRVTSEDNGDFPVLIPFPEMKLNRLPLPVNQAPQTSR